MPSSAEAIIDLEAAKRTLEGQRAGGGESSAPSLLIAIQRIADEIIGLKEGAGKPAAPAAAAFGPRSDAFKSPTVAGKAFAGELESVAAEFASVAAVAPALDKIRRYIG